MGLLAVKTLQGHGRSAVTAAAILIAMGKADSVENALTKVVQVSTGVGGKGGGENRGSTGGCCKERGGLGV